MALPVTAADPPPLAAYGRLPDGDAITLSLDGQRIASISTVGGRRAISIRGANPADNMVIDLGDVKVRSLDWVGNDSLIVQTSRAEDLGVGITNGQQEFWQAMIIPIGRPGPPRVVFDGKPRMLSAVFGNFGQRQVNGEWTAFFGGIELAQEAYGNAYIRNGSPALFRVGITHDRQAKIASAAGEDQWNDWLIGDDGRVAATLTLNRDSGDWTLRGPRGATLASGNHPQGAVGLLALGADGTSAIYSVGATGDAGTRWYEVPLAGGAAPREFLPDEDVERIYIDRTSGRMVGYYRGGDDGGMRLFAPERQGVGARIATAFPNLDWRLIDWTPDFSRLLIHTSGSGDSGTTHLFDVGTLQVSRVGADRSAIRPEHVGPISRVTYTAADGLELDGILTLPPGREARNLPMVMLPHGGPHAFEDATFDWWAQAFASHGYAVFQPNFRGSTGRDDAFERAGYGQWGRAMQSDISDGLAELARQGIVDPSRACIVGASYGGYAALAGVTLQQGLYRCAVAVAGISDIGEMFRDDYRDGGERGLLKASLLEELGPRNGFAAISPVRFAERADAPILLIHGRDDTVVPFDQSSRMLRALEAAGKPVRLVELREEDHWLSRAPTRQQMLEEAVAFVTQHNPAD